jgi:hypothetical protein
MREKDLKERTYQFAREVRDFLKVIPNKAGNVEDTRQLLRSSGSIGANYLEADNALTAARDNALPRARHGGGLGGSHFLVFAAGA